MPKGIGYGKTAGKKMRKAAKKGGISGSAAAWMLRKGK